MRPGNRGSEHKGKLSEGSEPSFPTGPHTRKNSASFVARSPHGMETPCTTPGYFALSLLYSLAMAVQTVLVRDLGNSNVGGKMLNASFPTPHGKEGSVSQ